MLLIDAIAEVETGNKIPAQSGDHGAALSVFQIHKEVWQDVHQRWGLKSAAEHIDVGQMFIAIGGEDSTSRLRARNTATCQVVLIEEFLQRHGVDTTAENIYACWNLGMKGFKRRHFKLDECPRRTITGAKEVARLADNKPHPETEVKR